MTLNIKTYICLTIVFQIYQNSYSLWIGSRCGFPGLPHETIIVPEKRVYEDGEEVSYSCPKDEIYKKTQVKKCVAGVWTGPRSTCGFFIKDQLMSVLVINLSTNETILDINTSNYSGFDFPASFFEERGTTVLINEAHLPHKWYFEFSQPILFDFFLLNIRIPKLKSQSRVAFNEIDSIRVKDIQVLNEDNRTCFLDYSTRENSKKIFWFWCSESSFNDVNQSLYISFTTYANHPMKAIGLHQVYLTKLQYCGRPPIPLLTHYVAQNDESEQIECDLEFSIPVKTSYEDNSNSNVSNLVFNDMEEREYGDCVNNQYWAGMPKCVPKHFCKLKINAISEEISSVRNAYKFNNSLHWYAIEGTSITFKCKVGYKMSANFIRTCLHNSTWDQNGPICLPLEVFESSLFLSPSFIAPIIVFLLIIIIIIIVLLVILKRRKRRNLEPNIESNLAKKADYFNDYEDIPHYGNEVYSEPLYEDYEQNLYQQYDDNRIEGSDPNQLPVPAKGNRESKPPLNYYLRISRNGDHDSGNGEYIHMTKPNEPYDVPK